jgi:hypothetical protein
MPNYITSALLTAQAKLATKYTEAEMRRKVRPAINLALSNQEFSFPDANALKVAEQRPVEVHFLTRKAAGASTVKAARHTGNKGDSAKITLAWSRFTETFSFSRKLAFNKMFGAQELFNNEMEQAILNIQDRAETAAIAHLVANRCQLLAANIVTSGAGTWNDTNKQLVITPANKDYFIQMIKTFMYGRHYRGELDAIVDLIQYPVLERVMNQGAGNSTNTGFQFGGVNITPTTDTILGANTLGQALVMPKGLFAGLPWNDPLNRQGFGRDSDYVGTLTTMRDPFGLNCSYDVSVYTDRANTAAIDGHVQDINDEYEVSLLVGFNNPPLSTSLDSVIHLVAQG